MMRKTLTLLFLGSFPWGMACAAVPDTEGIVLVGTAIDMSRERLTTGFIADDKGHVIARINAPDKTLYVNLPDGVIYEADSLAYDSVSGLSVLKIAQDVENLKPYTFAHEPAELQRKVFGIKMQGALDQSQVVEGTLASVQQPESGSPGYYLHNALVGRADAGGPLLNNCGEVIGVIVPQPGLLARLLRSRDESTAYAVPIEWLLSQFDIQEMNLVHAETTCLSDADQVRQSLEAAQAKLEEEARRTAEATQAATEGQARLEEEARRTAEATQAATERQAELDAVKRQLEEAQGASEAERQALEAEVEARQRAADEARAQEVAAREAHEAAQEAAHKAALKREEQYMMWGIIGAAMLLLLLLLVWVMKQRTVNRERREKVAASSRAETAQASLATREEDAARIRQTPTVFFEGADSAGQTVALRVPGASIAASDGAVVGRNPDDSDFVINHPQVSRRQFRLFTDGRLLMIEDLDSTNGTRVDGKMLGAEQNTHLADLSQVELSDLKLSVRLEQGELTT